jgi:sugar lactone lactonase YvrE
MGGVGVGGTGMGGSGICDGGMGGMSCPDYTPPGPPVGLSVNFVAGVNVSTLAGSGVPGAADGTGAGVSLSNPVSLALASNGDLFVAEYDGNQIRRITPAGVSTTVMPIGTLNQPFGIGAASDSVLYVDTDHDPQGLKTSLTSGTIWRVDVAAQSATVIKADMGRPRGVAVLPDGRIALSDYRNHRLLLLDPQTSAVTPLAGNGCAGYADGQGTAARFSMPYGIAVAPDGSLVVADYGNQRLRTVKLDGTVGTLAGDGVNGMVDGAAMQARFFSPEDVAVDATGAIYVSDVGNHRVRRLAQGQVQTLAGDGMEGFADGAGNMAEFYGQEGIAVTPDGRTVYVADGTGGAEGLPLPPYHRIRAIAVPAGH